MESDSETLTEGVKIFMYKNQTQAPEERRQIRDKYQELIEDARKEKEKEELNMDIIIHSMNKADVLFKDVFDSQILSRITKNCDIVWPDDIGILTVEGSTFVPLFVLNLVTLICRPQEALYDARLVGIHSEIAKKHAHQLQVENPFNCGAFLRKLAYDLTGTYSDSDVNLDEKAWLKLGNSVSHMFNMTPKLTFMHGTFSEAVRSTSHQRHYKEKDSKSESTNPKIIAGTSRSRRGDIDKTYAEIQRIKKILYHAYERNGGKPICYFHFTVDPNSFSRTIENMFHLSFLIKECEVCLSMDSNELPVIEPLLSDGNTAATETSQSVLTMNVDLWKRLIEVFGITRPFIPPSKHVMR